MTVALIYNRPYPRLALDYMVAAIKGQDLNHELVVFTNEQVEGVRCIPLERDIAQGYWGKMQLFKHPELGRTLYIDLDCLVVGSLKKLFDARGTTVVGHDPSPDGDYRTHQFCAGIFLTNLHEMGWLWWEYLASKEEIERNYPHDQAWLNKQDLMVEAWPDHYITSYKWRGAGSGDAILIHFHGKPKWWDIDGG